MLLLYLSSHWTYPFLDKFWTYPYHQVKNARTGFCFMWRWSPLASLTHLARPTREPPPNTPSGWSNSAIGLHASLVTGDIFSILISGARRSGLRNCIFILFCFLFSSASDLIWLQILATKVDSDWKKSSQLIVYFSFTMILD